MNIAICEDSMQMLGKLEMLVYECYNGDDRQFTCDTFLSGEEMLNSISKDHTQYQIYILDIEMKAINGLETASMIRKTDQNAAIIFVTSHSELMQEAFDVLAFHYLIKPINEEKAKQVILRAIEAQSQRKTTFHYKVKKKISTLCFEQIEYFESYKRKIYIHLTDGADEYYGKLKDVLGQAGAGGFVQVHNSYVVNMDYIKFTDALHVILRSGAKIPITKKYYNEFNATYRNYVLKRML
ncbi:MAG: LytTR family DNA-binding domain-containing protein [Hungatella sp.]|jgi:DNA-binding LytR/AlgR family response regulator|nr:LytTR family DNA-binding domain-containing protein [Hungatella sp.]